MVESCPDGEKDSYFTGISRIFRFRLVCLLMTETCNMAAFMTFWSNISYLTEVSYGRSAMTCSVAMLTFGGMNFLGLFVMERLQFGSVLQAAKISASLYASTGLLLFIVGSFFSKLFWAYLLGTFLQAFFSILVPRHRRQPELGRRSPAEGDGVLRTVRVAVAVWGETLASWILG